MTDLQKLSALKNKPFVTNCFITQSELFDSEGYCKFESEIGENFFFRLLVRKDTSFCFVKPNLF